jgi:hypothetical protein
MKAMPTNNQKSTKRRTQVKDLPKQEKELSKEEQKKVKGGDFIEKRYDGGESFGGKDFIEK